MSLEQAVAFVMFSVVAAGTPGPANVLVAATAAAVGARRATACLLGVVLGTGLLLAVLSFGLGAVILEHSGVALGVKVAGATLLLWLAFRIATAPVDCQDAGPDRPVGFMTAAALQWLNPKSWTVGASAAATFLSADEEGALIQAVLMGGLFCLAALPACGLWLAVGAGMRGMLTTSRGRRRFNQTMGMVLAASVVLVFV